MQVREREAESDVLIGPIEEMYALLRKYEVRVPAEELAAVSDLRYSWKKLLSQAVEVSDKLGQLQASSPPPPVPPSKPHKISSLNTRALPSRLYESCTLQT